MRRIRDADLSSEQKAICFAPHQGRILVVGPPGSGKTVVALQRADGLKELGKTHKVLVYNHVLRKYTGTQETFYGWLNSWWKICTGNPFPKTQIFVVENGKEIKRYINDFKKAREYVIANGASFTNQSHWGHLILDEAQDFAPQAHALLSSVSARYEKYCGGRASSIMILADENQRLGKENATIENIKTAHFLRDEDVYKLTKNYRNTKEISRFASTFYVGLPSGIPTAPTRSGDKPSIRMTQGINDSVDLIERWALTHDDQEIGVLVFYKNTRKIFFNKLAHRLKDRGINVQSYVSDSKDPNSNPDRLIFDKGGTVTVLCFASAKGLEFDTVFLPELQSFPVEAFNRDNVRMNLYVMTSRARDNLFLTISDPGGNAPIWSLLPKDSSLYRME
jgi:superfamily I DNA/RNA helicase